MTDMDRAKADMSSAVTTHASTDIVGGNCTTGVRNPYLEYSQWGWANDPLGLRYFFPLLGRELSETRCWRGMEKPEDWQKEENGCSRAESVRQWGLQWAQRLTEDSGRATL